MSPIAAAIILVTVLVTSFISGIFGMAGGIIFMGVLAALVPVATAMIVHGAVQMVSNGYRAFLWRDHIDWHIFRRYATGSVLAVGLLFALSWRPDSNGAGNARRTHGGRTYDNITSATPRSSCRLCKVSWASSIRCFF